MTTTTPSDPSSEARALSRREMLQMGAAGAVALGMGTALGADAAEASTSQLWPGSQPFRIDVHHHQVSAALHASLLAQGLTPTPPSFAPFVPWSLPTALAVMDSHRIQAAVLSSAIPDTVFPSEAALGTAARGSNNGMAATVAAMPNRFGFFGYIPLPYVNRSLAEIAYVFDTLHADGVNLMAQAGGKYLGDPMFDPVLEELNRRNAVIFTHPNRLPGGDAPGVFSFLADFMLDTTRAAIRMIQANTLQRFPNLKIILPHGGGFLPYIGSRLELGHFLGSGVDPGMIAAALSSFYYDTAMWTSPYATPSLRRAADRRKLLFGTDYNAIPVQAVTAATQDFEADPQIGPILGAQIGRTNALALLPTLAARMGA